MAKDVNKVTEYTYVWNTKTGGYQPKGMKVTINEMIEGLPDPEMIESDKQIKLTDDTNIAR